MALVVGNTPGTDLALREDKVKGYKHFANKLWNIARFSLESADGVDMSAPLNAADTALLDEYNAILTDVAKDMDAYRPHLAAEKLYHYVWDRFAAEILEESKPILQGDDKDAKASRQALLLTLLERSLRALHPFMPFVTEEIYQSLPQKDSELLMVAAWPNA